MKRMDDPLNASTVRIFSSPGIPKTYLTPSFSKQRTKNCAAFMGGLITFFTSKVSSLCCMRFNPLHLELCGDLAISGVLVPVRGQKMVPLTPKSHRIVSHKAQ